MDFKEQVVASLKQVLPTELTTEKITALLEVPKNDKMGDLAFPTFILAKSLHQSPVKIAADLAEKIDQTNFEKVQAVGPYVNFFFKQTEIGNRNFKSCFAAASRVWGPRSRPWWECTD